MENLNPQQHHPVEEAGTNKTLATDNLASTTGTTDVTPVRPCGVPLKTGQPCPRVADRCVLHPSGEDLADLARRIDAGTLQVILNRVLPFAQIGEALAHLESGRAKGKVVVRMVD